VIIPHPVEGNEIASIGRVGVGGGEGRYEFAFTWPLSTIRSRSIDEDVMKSEGRVYEGDREGRGGYLKVGAVGSE
jgi:hypothetical protein